MIRDLPIDQLPKGAVWDQVDMVPSLASAGLVSRGHWARHSATLGGGTTASALTIAPFASGPQLVAINSSGAVKQVDLAGAGAVTARGTAQVPFQQPVFYREKVYIPSDNGATTVKYYDGANNAAAASGSPPAGMMAVAWKDHLVLARDASNPKRMWFSNGGDPTVWDTAADGQWLDLNDVPNGLAQLRGMILSFSETSVERVRGDIIPGVAGSDVVRETMLSVGCPDPAAIAATDDYVIFANSDGVFLTDGIGLVNLTEQCGILSYYTASTFGQINNFTGGIWRGHYILSVYSGSTLINTFVFDIAKRRAWRLTNVLAAMMATAPTNVAGSASGELFFAELDSPFISRLSFMWIHAGSGAFDGNGTYPLPAVQTGFFRGTQGRKRWRRLYITYTHEGTTGTVGWNFDRTLTAANTTGTLPTTTDAAVPTPRAAVTITASKQSDAISVYLAEGGNSATDFRVFSIEGELRPIEQSR
jgi:hypothetical protein